MSCSWLMARLTGMPRTESTMRRTLRGAMRMPRACAKTSTALPLDSGRALDRLAAAMAAEMARRRELAQLVADHVLGDVDGHVAPAVVHRDRVADHLREDGRGARPRLEHALFAAAVHLLDAAEQLDVDEWTLLERAGHTWFSCRLARGAPPDDQTVASLLRLARPHA